MATENDEDLEVKKDGEIIPENEDDDKDDPDSSQDGNTDPEDGDEPDDGDDENKAAPADTIPPVKKEVIAPKNGQLVRQSGESDREWALRLENKRLRDNQRGERTKEITEQPKPAPIKTQKADSEVLKKYKPEDIQALREVLPELAAEMGYVRKDELASQTYESIANEQIELFIANHPEYSPEKDPEGILWNRLKEEYQSVYKPPANPKNFNKIFERIHKDVFGIEPKGPLPKDNAAREKIKVASHGPNSAPVAPRTQARKQASGGLRLDMLQGFSDEEKANIEARVE